MLEGMDFVRKRLLKCPILVSLGTAHSNGKLLILLSILSIDSLDGPLIGNIFRIQEVLF